MLQTAVASRLDAYLAKKTEYERRRRKIRVDFDALYSMFAADQSSARIARKAGVSRPRIDHIYEQYFRDLFGMTGLQRRQRREEELREHGVRRLAKAFAKDRVLRAISQSADRAKRRRTIEPIICKRGRDPTKRFRHKAVRVDGRNVEPVHHIRNKKICPSGGTTYGVTSVSREELKASTWSIFYVDVASYRRRVIRSRSMKLLKALFPPGVARKNIYIPLDRKPEDPRYDFLADEDNWG
jgi:hypothetical protein